MSAHAVKDKHQSRVFGDDNSSPILIILSISERRNFSVFDFHNIKVALIGLRRRPQLRMAVLVKT